MCVCVCDVVGDGCGRLCEVDVLMCDLCFDLFWNDVLCGEGGIA